MGELHRDMLKARVSAMPFLLDPAGEARSSVGRRAHLGFNARMLAEDLGIHRHAYDPAVQYAGPGANAADELLGALLSDFADEPGRRRRRDVEASLWELIEIVGREHFKYGRCLFELHLSSDVVGDEIQGLEIETPVASNLPVDAYVRLGFLPGWTVRSRFGSIAQIRPGDSNSRWARIPRETVQSIGLPDRLSRRLYRTRRRLNVVDQYRAGGVSGLEVISLPGYDANVQIATSNELLALVTADVGWDTRSLLADKLTSPHSTYRRLRFLRTWLTIVDATLTQLNALTKSPGLYSSSTFSVAIDGLPLIQDVDAGIHSLLCGQRSIDSLTNELLHPRYRKQQ